MVVDAGDGVGLKHVIDHQKIIIISLEYHPSLHHNTHTHAQDRIQTMYQVDWAERGGILLETLGICLCKQSWCFFKLNSDIHEMTIYESFLTSNNLLFAWIKS